MWGWEKSSVLGTPKRSLTQSSQNSLNKLKWLWLDILTLAVTVVCCPGDYTVDLTGLWFNLQRT